MKVEIRIGRLTNTDTLFPEVSDATYTEGKLESVGILERGMTSGKASLWLNIKMPDGTYTTAQVSASIFEEINGALQGAIKNFSHNPGGSN